MVWDWLIIGSGFGGLALAIRLQSAGIQTTIVEARDKRILGYFSLGLLTGPRQPKVFLPEVETHLWGGLMLTLVLAVVGIVAAVFAMILDVSAAVLVPFSLAAAAVSWRAAISPAWTENFLMMGNTNTLVGGQQPGVLSVLQLEGSGKQGRSTQQVQILTRRSEKQAVIDACFHETRTLGLRYRQTERWTLERRPLRVELPEGPVGVKLSRGPGGWQAKAEDRDLRRFSGHQERRRIARLAEAAALQQNRAHDRND